MKRRFLMAMTVAVLTLSGCGATTADTAEVEAVEVEGDSEPAEELVDDSADKDELRARYLEQAEYGDILDLSYEGEPLAPSVVVDDYMSGRHIYRDQYYTTDANGYFEATAYLGDGHILKRSYIPKATCKGEWTVEGIVESYQEMTWPWTRIYDHGVPILYSEDYRHEFMIFDDWLTVDNIEVRPVGYCYESLEPSSVLDAYQNGLWDGTASIFSVDCATVARIDSEDGTLLYKYKAVRYADDYDVMDLAYKQYLDPPLCVSTGNDSNYEVSYHGGYDCDYDEFSATVFTAAVDVYMDLPNGSMDDFDDLLQYVYCGLEDGMLMVMPDRIEQYKCGTLTATWKCNVSKSLPRVEQLYGKTYAWISDDEIVQLLPGGEVEVVLGGLTGDWYSIADHSHLLELSLENGKLAGYNSFCGVINITDNIESIDYSRDIALMTGKDGLCYAFTEDDYRVADRQARDTYDLGRSPECTIPVHCLGEDSWEHYLELYEAGMLEL